MLTLESRACFLDHYSLAAVRVSAMSSPEEVAKALKLAEQEMEYRVELFNKYEGV